jgi:hypothetical protein
MKAITATLEAVVEADRKFFEENPELDEYIRPIFPCEISEAKSIGCIHADSVQVKRVAEGVRVRIFFTRSPSGHCYKKRAKSKGFGVAHA